MRGSRRARHGVTSHLRAHLNDVVARTAAADAIDLAPVEEMHPSWTSMNRVERWPVLMMTAQRGINRGRIDWDQGDPVHQWDWTLRAWLWCRGDTFEETADRVEATADALVETLLAWPAIGDGRDRMKVSEEGMSVSLSDIENDPKTRASIAGAYVEFVITMAETAATDPLGVAETISLIVEPKE